MVYKVQPVLYAVNDEHKSTIRFTVDFLDDIEPDALAYAVEQVGKRYPQFKN